MPVTYMAGFSNSLIMINKFLKVLISLLFSITAFGEEPGEWLIVNYWSEWCAPCRIEIPTLNELSEYLAASNVSIVGINFDEDPRDATLEIAEELGVIFPTLNKAEVKALALRPPDVMPTTYILAPNNEVAAKLVGMQSRDDILNELKRLHIEIQIN